MKRKIGTLAYTFVTAIALTLLSEVWIEAQQSISDFYNLPFGPRTNAPAFQANDVAIHYYYSARGGGDPYGAWGAGYVIDQLQNEFEIYELIHHVKQDNSSVYEEGPNLTGTSFARYAFHLKDFNRRTCSSRGCCPNLTVTSIDVLNQTPLRSSYTFEGKADLIWNPMNRSGSTDVRWLLPWTRTGTTPDGWDYNYYDGHLEGVLPSLDASLFVHYFESTNFPNVHNPYFGDSRCRWTIYSVMDPADPDNCAASEYAWGNGRSIVVQFSYYPGDTWPSSFPMGDLIGAQLAKLPVVSVSGLTNATEGVTNAGIFRIYRYDDQNFPVTVQYTVSGTATAGSDFAALSGSATIPAGQTSVDVLVNQIDDNIYEGTETVVLTLVTNAAYIISVPSASISISDNELKPVISVTGSGNAAEPSQTASFSVSTSRAIQYPLVVNFTKSGTATAGVDYQSLPNSVTIPGGTSAGGSVTLGTVTPIDDALDEPTETVIVTLSGNSGYTVSGSAGSATVKLLDNEATSVYIVATDSSAAEAALNTGQYTVYREGGSTAAFAASLSVPVVYSGTATSVSDYQALPATVTIPANQNSKTITATPVNDSVYEGPETIIATLSSPNQGVRVVGAAATINLADDEPLPIVAASGYQNGAEGGASAYIVFYVSNVAIERPLTIFYTIGGSATLGSDYTGPTGSYVLTGPRSAGSFNGPAIPIVNDLIHESTETITHTVTPNAAYTVSPTSPTGSVTITDND